MEINRKRVDSRQLVLCGLFAALVAIGAFIRIPLPLIPFTLQTFFVTMAGFLLGARYGGLSVALYVALGLFGLPIFTQGGGPSYVFNPTFGYLIGFIIEAYVVGKLTGGRGVPSLKRLLVAGFVGLAVAYLLGGVYCYFITNFVLGIHNSAWAVFLSGCVLVFPGNAVFNVLAAYAARRILPHMPDFSR